MVSSYLLKHDSESFCEGIDTFWKRLSFKSVDFESSRLCSLMWVGLIQSDKALNRARSDFSTAFRLKMRFFLESPRLLARPHQILHSGSLDRPMSQFLKINLPPFLHPTQIYWVFVVGFCFVCACGLEIFL